MSTNTPREIPPDVLARVVALVAESEGTDAGPLTAATRLDDDLGMDSLSKAELQMKLEDVFGIEIDDERVASVRTIGDVVRLVERPRG